MMYIVEVVNQQGGRRYVLIDLGARGDTSEARRRVEERLPEGHFGNVSVTADESGLATLRRDAPQFTAQFGATTSLADVLSRLEGVSAVVTGPASGAPAPGDPLSAETGVAGTGVAFRRALESIPGMAPFRGVGQDLRAPLSNIFDIGGLAGLTSGPFADIGQGDREEFAVGDFFRNALSSLRRGASTIGGLASQAFTAPQNLLTSRFFNPDFSMTTEPGGESPTTRLRNAEQFAQLARLAAREQFGTVLARRLAGPQKLVEQYRAQPLDTAEEDFRTFLQSRTSR